MHCSGRWRPRQSELKIDFAERLAMLEEQKSLPWATVWDYYCLQKGVRVGRAWFDEIRQCETKVLAKRARA